MIFRSACFKVLVLVCLLIVLIRELLQHEWRRHRGLLYLFLYFFLYLLFSHLLLSKGPNLLLLNNYFLLVLLNYIFELDQALIYTEIAYLGLTGFLIESSDVAALLAVDLSTDSAVCPSSQKRKSFETL